MMRQQTRQPDPPVTPFMVTASVLVILATSLLMGGGFAWGHALGYGACEATHPSPITVRGSYDAEIAQECVGRGEAIVLVLDLATLEGGGSGTNRFACAAGPLQSLTERAK